jgi:hypothetical protein
VLASQLIRQAWPQHASFVRRLLTAEVQLSFAAVLLLLLQERLEVLASQLIGQAWQQPAGIVRCLLTAEVQLNFAAVLLLLLQERLRGACQPAGCGRLGSSALPCRHGDSSTPGRTQQLEQRRCAGVLPDNSKADSSIMLCVMPAVHLDCLLTWACVHNVVWHGMHG